MLTAPPPPARRLTPDAFSEIYERNSGAAFALAWRTVGDRETAAEIVQDVFLRLWERPERFDPSRGTVRTFLLVETHGRCADRLRSSGRRARREERFARAVPDEKLDLSLEVWDMTVAEKVREALVDLSAHERRAIELAYFTGRSYREVAEVLDEPEGTIKSRIRSGLAKLRDRLVSEGIDEPWMET